jgi:hypothetical protein
MERTKLDKIMLGFELYKNIVRSHMKHLVDCYLEKGIYINIPAAASINTSCFLLQAYNQNQPRD